MVLTVFGLKRWPWTPLRRFPAALRDSSGWLVSLAVSGGSVDSKLVRCFFRTSPDVRAAALAFLFILDLGAIDKNHTFNRDLFPSHGRSFPEKNFGMRMRSKFTLEKNLQRDVTARVRVPKLSAKGKLERFSLKWNKNNITGKLF